MEETVIFVENTRDLITGNVSLLVTLNLKTILMENVFVSQVSEEIHQLGHADQFAALTKFGMEDVSADKDAVVIVETVLFAHPTLKLLDNNVYAI